MKRTPLVIANETGRVIPGVGYQPQLILSNERRIPLEDLAVTALRRREQCEEDLNQLMRREMALEKEEIAWQIKRGISQGMLHRGYV